MFLLHLLHLKLCIFLPELLIVHIWFCAFFTGYKANRRRWLNWVHIGQKNCFHISQLENVRNPNNLQYLQWRSKTLFPSAEICFYVTAGSGSPLNLTAPPLSRAAKSQHMNFIITVTKSSANPFIRQMKRLLCFI